MTLRWTEFHQWTSYTRQAPAPVQDISPTPTRPEDGLKLPEPELLNIPLQEALQERRSHTSGFEAFDLQALSNLLKHAVGSSGPLWHGVQRRTYPSAGGFYPVAVQVVSVNLPDLPRGVYRYEALGHSLQWVGGFDPQELDFLMDNTSLQEVPALVFLTGNFEQPTRKYGDRAYRFLLQESGHIMQNLQLVGTALQFNTLPLGCFKDDTARQLLSNSEEVLYAMLLGKSPRATPVIHAKAQYLQHRLYTPQLNRLMPEILSLPAGKFWFMVKGDGGEHLRLRFAPEIQTEVQNLVQAGQEQGWISAAPLTPYEPEVGLFGGETAMQHAHRFFEMDAWLALHAHKLDTNNRYLTSHLWMTLMLRSCGLDSFEQWDVWQKLGQVRPPARPEHHKLVEQISAAVQRIGSLSTDRLWEELLGRVPEMGVWKDELTLWGKAMQGLLAHGPLERGLRSILAVHVIFHSNRMLFNLTEQVLFTAAWQHACQPE